MSGTGLAPGKGTSSPAVRLDWNTRDVSVGGHRYPYHFGYDCLDRIVWHLGRYDADRFFVVTDDRVLDVHGAPLVDGLARQAPVHVLSRPRGEAMKSLPALTAHLESAIRAGATRRSLVVAFGGGVPGNLAGVLAGLLFRGIRLVHVPTTTVAAMDSVISLKQAVNSSRGKNHIGMYHAPEAVYTDVRMLCTLPGRELRSGLCEATKNCLAIRPGSIGRLREVLRGGGLDAPEVLLWLLDESLAAKLQAMRDDAHEQRTGLVLEYGHTVGHAIELCDQRVRGSDGIAHGEAVALGMVAAARVSMAMGGLDAEAVTLHEELVSLLGVAVRRPEGSTTADLIDVVAADNKRGYLRLHAEECALVLLRSLGVPMGRPDCPLTVVPMSLLARVLDEFP
jgi:3-dehydroquinate synthase/2-deoxy-scyllo-inosose synthase